MTLWENLPSYLVAIQARGVSLARSRAETLQCRVGRASHAAEGNDRRHVTMASRQSLAVAADSLGILEYLFRELNKEHERIETKASVEENVRKLRAMNRPS